MSIERKDSKEREEGNVRETVSIVDILSFILFIKEWNALCPYSH